MSPDERRAIDVEFLLTLQTALVHQAAVHGPSVLVSDDLCEAGALLVCGKALWEKMVELRIEIAVRAGGVAQAEQIINKFKR